MNQKYTMTQSSRLAVALTVASGVLLGALTLNAAPKPKYTTEEVMKALHKGKESLGKKVSDGHGTKEDFKKLLEYYPSLPLNEPPKGDLASWKTKTAALLKATRALDKGTPGALDQYKEAVNCKACHSVHKEDKH